MPPKKKEAGSEEEDPSPKLFLAYKKKCDQVGTFVHLPLKLILEEAAEKGPLQCVREREEIGPLHVRALFEAMAELRYCKFKAIKLWRCGAGDEGVRHICLYLETVRTNSVETLDLLENGISLLGCEFLGKTLASPTLRIQHLKLDNNPIGSEGLKLLSVGLRSNPTLRKLSLKNCNIDEEGAIFIQEILANINSQIRSLKLQGNRLQNQGLFHILRALNINEMLEKLNIADTGLDLLGFKALRVVRVEKREEQQFMEEAYSPGEKHTSISNHIDNDKEVTPLLGPVETHDSPEKSYKHEREEPELEEKVQLTIAENDSSKEGAILKLLTSVMRNSLIMKKYDLRFNPISNDAARIICTAVEENGVILNVELNINVNCALREDLDTLMRMRTCRMPKGRPTRKKKKKK